MFIKWEQSLEGLILDKLGPLKQLNGVWRGRGFTAISRPDGQHGNTFKVKLNATEEVLAFFPIFGHVTNRGATHAEGNQGDISIYGLMYIQLIVNLENLTEVLHFETGQWLLVPPTTAPLSTATIVRQATILHGATFIASGDAASFEPRDARPDIPDVDIRPKVDDPPYLRPYEDLALPSGISKENAIHPNNLLKEAIQDTNITNTATITLSGSVSENSPPLAPSNNINISPANPPAPTPDIANIPFLRHNAQVTNLTATFYVKSVSDEGKEPFTQLQYTQNTILNFSNVDWPHVSVATLKPLQEGLPGFINRFLSK